MFGRRCKAVREYRNGPRLIDTYWGRCDLDKGHEGPHELERGFIHLYWSTEWII